MEKQINFADIEYGNRRRKTKREEFLEKMESVIPWGKWVEIIEPYPFDTETSPEYKVIVGFDESSVMLFVAEMLPALSTALN